MDINEKNMMFIVGKNLAEYFQSLNIVYADNFLTEDTFVDLFKNVNGSTNFDSRKRQFSTQPLIVTEIKITPYKGTKSLLVRGIVNSDSGKQYQTIIMFTRIKYVDDIDDVNDIDADTVDFTANNGEEYKIERINLNTNDVKVRCECLDFRWRFADYNAANKDLYGRKPPPYVKKTNRGPVNPNKVPGVCKHLIKTFEVLMESDLVTKTNTNPS